MVPTIRSVNVSVAVMLTRVGNWCVATLVWIEGLGGGPTLFRGPWATSGQVPTCDHVLWVEKSRLLYNVRTSSYKFNPACYDKKYVYWNQILFNQLHIMTVIFCLISTNSRAGRLKHHVYLHEPATNQNQQSHQPTNQNQQSHQPSNQRAGY